MAKAPTTTNATNDIKPVELLAIELGDAHSLATTCFNDLSMLFRAIEKFADDPHIEAISRMGWGLADDWGNLTDCNLGHATEDAKAILVSLEGAS